MAGDPRSDVGPIAEYLRDITKLPPEVTRIEQLNFRRTVAARAVTFTSPSTRVDPEYVFALRRVLGAVSFTAANADAIDNHRMEFNVRDQGRARGGVFNDPINMAILAGNGGPSGGLCWDSFYAFVPGSDVIVDWTILGALADFKADGNITYFVSLLGDLVRVRRLADGTLMIPGVSGPKDAK